MRFPVDTTDEPALRRVRPHSRALVPGLFPKPSSYPQTLLPDWRWGLATQKNEVFRRKLQQFGVDGDREAVRFVRELRSHGVRIGLAS